MGFQLHVLPKSVTFVDSEQRNGRYFALFYRIRQLLGANYVKVVWTLEIAHIAGDINVVQRI